MQPKFTYRGKPISGPGMTASISRPTDIESLYGKQGNLNHALARVNEWRGNAARHLREARRRRKAKDGDGFNAELLEGARRCGQTAKENGTDSAKTMRLFMISEEQHDE